MLYLFRVLLVVVGLVVELIPLLKYEHTYSGLNLPYEIYILYNIQLIWSHLRNILHFVEGPLRVREYGELVLKSRLVT